MADLRSERFRNQNTRLNVVQVKDLIPVVDDMQDIIDGDFAFEDPIEYSNATGITAGTTQTQAGATALTEEQNNVTTVATAGDGVALPAAIAGGAIKVKNSGAATLAVYPATADSINALAVNLSVDIAPNSEMTFRAINATRWETLEVLTLPAPTTQTGSLVIQAADSAGNTNTTITNASQAGARTYTIPDGGTDASFLLTQSGGTQTIGTGSLALTVGHMINSLETGVTATNPGAQGGQAITKQVTEVTTVANQGDSVTLPAAVTGQLQIVMNEGVEILSLFPASGDRIEGSPVDTQTSILPQSNIILIPIDATTWRVIAGSKNSFDSGLTADAGSAQDITSLIKAEYNEYSTVTLAGDSATLPAPTHNGDTYVVINKGGNSMDVFPFTGQNINGNAANAAFAVGVASSTTFVGLTGIGWITY